jgi:hypothetical protein
MPSIQAQIDYLSIYRQRFLTIVSEARRNGQELSISQAERFVMQQFERELIQLTRHQYAVSPHSSH